MHKSFAIGLLAVVTMPVFAAAQTAPDDENIRNEYRVTLVTTRPAADREKLILFQYLGVVENSGTALASKLRSLKRGPGHRKPGTRLPTSNRSGASTTATSSAYGFGAG